MRGGHGGIHVQPRACYIRVGTQALNAHEAQKTFYLDYHIACRARNYAPNCKIYKGKLYAEQFFGLRKIITDHCLNDHDPYRKSLHVKLTRVAEK